MKYLKAIKFSGLLFSLICFFGCSGMSEKKSDVQNDNFIIRGSVSLQQESKSVGRAAYPSFEIINEIKWSVTAVCDDETVAPIESECTDEGNFNIQIPLEGVWSFSAVGRTGDTIVMQSITPVEVYVEKLVRGFELEPISIIVYPVCLEDYTGSIKLLFHDETEEFGPVSKIKFSFTDQVIENGEILFNEKKVANFEIDEIPAGLHNVIFDFFNQDNIRISSYVDTIVIFSGFETNTWQKSGNNTFILMDELFYNFEETELPSDFEYPIVLWNKKDSAEGGTTGTWSSSVGYALFSQISENIKLEDGVLFGKNINNFWFDDKNFKIYASEPVGNEIYLFSYPSYAGYEVGKYIPVDVSASPACIYDGNIWFVTVIDNTYRISKLINGKLESYSICNSDNTEIQFSSNIPESQDVRASLKLCADSEYIYALYSYQNKVTYKDEWNNDCSYIQDCTFELKKFAISDNDKKLIKLAECEVTAVEDFEITAEEQTSIFDGDFKINDFMVIKESDNETSLYALLCDEPVRGGIAKFKSTITEGNHTLELGTINSRKLYGWWYSDTVAADLEELREAAQAVDELDNTHQLQFRTRYSISQLKGRNPFELASLGDATITDYIRGQWAENEQYYGPVDETAILNALVPVNEIIARIREAASAQTVMYAPQKFIARKPDELIIAEEDGYGYDDNTNRVYSLNLRTLSVTKTTVNVSFNGYMESGYHSF